MYRRHPGGTCRQDADVTDVPIVQLFRGHYARNRRARVYSRPRPEGRGDRRTFLEGRCPRRPPIQPPFAPIEACGFPSKTFETSAEFLLRASIRCLL